MILYIISMSTVISVTQYDAILKSKSDYIISQIKSIQNPTGDGKAKKILNLIESFNFALLNCSDPLDRRISLLFGAFLLNQVFEIMAGKKDQNLTLRGPFKQKGNLVFLNFKDSENTPDDQEMQSILEETLLPTYMIRHQNDVFMNYGLKCSSRKKVKVIPVSLSRVLEILSKPSTLLGCLPDPLNVTVFVDMRHGERKSISCMNFENSSLEGWYLQFLGESDLNSNDIALFMKREGHLFLKSDPEGNKFQWGKLASRNMLEKLTISLPRKVQNFNNFSDAMRISKKGQIQIRKKDQGPVLEFYGLETDSRYSEESKYDMLFYTDKKKEPSKTFGSFDKRKSSSGLEESVRSAAGFSESKQKEREGSPKKRSTKSTSTGIIEMRSIIVKKSNILEKRNSVSMERKMNPFKSNIPINIESPIKSPLLSTSVLGMRKVSRVISPNKNGRQEVVNNRHPLGSTINSQDSPNINETILSKPSNFFIIRKREQPSNNSRTLKKFNEKN